MVRALHCGGCVKTITGTLEALPSVEVTQADTETKLVRVQFDDSAVTVDQIREALDEIGFIAEAYSSGEEKRKKTQHD